MLKPEIQRFLLYLWTSPESDTPGIYYISIPTIADDLGISIRMVEQRLRYGIKEGWLMYDFECRIIFFPKWFEYDPPSNANTVISYKNKARDLPESNLIPLYLKTLIPYAIRYNVPIGEAYTQPVGTPSPEQEHEQEQEPSPEPKKQPRVFDAAVVDLAEHFRFRIEDNGLEKRCPTLKTEKWLTATCSEIDKMMRLDKRTHEQIKIIIDYIQDDNRPNESNGFCWARNVMTGDKLRKHYQTIVNRIRDKHEGERWSPFEPLFYDNA